MRLVLLAVFFVATVLSPLHAHEFSGTLEQIKETGKMRVGYRKDLPPMSFEDSQGQPVGYSIDLCTQIFSEVEKTIAQDITLEFLPVSAKDRFDALTKNKIDILCGATTKTISRGKIVDFTELTFVTGGSFLTLKKTDVSKGFDGKKIGVTEGSTTLDALKTLLSEAGVKANLVEMKSSEEGFMALNKGDIDAFAADQVVLIGLALISGHPKDFRVSPDLFTYEPFALAVRRNDADFRLVADKVIAELYRTENIQKIYDKWFGAFAPKRSSAFEALIQINAIPE